MTATTAAFGLAVPTVSLPAQPQVPHAPLLPAVPVPLPQAPAVPTPKSPVPLPALPSPGGHAAPAPGAAPVRPGSAAQSVADAVAANGVALASRSRSAASTASGSRSAGQTGTTPQRRAAARRAVRERRFRRSVRRLSGCIGALPGLERRVLVLRAGLEGRRPRPSPPQARPATLRRGPPAPRPPSPRPPARERPRGPRPPTPTRGACRCSSSRSPPRHCWPPAQPPGWRLAHGALVQRAERSTDRRQTELVATVRGILGEHNR
jgi:hypothetical protein